MIDPWCHKADVVVCRGLQHGLCQPATWPDRSPGQPKSLFPQPCSQKGCAVLCKLPCRGLGYRSSSVGQDGRLGLPSSPFNQTSSAFSCWKETTGLVNVHDSSSLIDVSRSVFEDSRCWEESVPSRCLSAYWGGGEWVFMHRAGRKSRWGDGG